MGGKNACMQISPTSAGSAPPATCCVGGPACRARPCHVSGREECGGACRATRVLASQHVLPRGQARAHPVPPPCARVTAQDGGSLWRRRLLLPGQRRAQPVAGSGDDGCSIRRLQRPVLPGEACAAAAQHSWRCLHLHLSPPGHRCTSPQQTPAACWCAARPTHVTCLACLQIGKMFQADPDHEDTEYNQVGGVWRCAPGGQPTPRPCAPPARVRSSLRPQRRPSSRSPPPLSGRAGQVHAAHPGAEEV